MVSIKLIGNVCRSKALWLSATFKSPCDADRQYCEAEREQLCTDSFSTSEMQVSPPELQLSVVSTSEMLVVLQELSIVPSQNLCGDVSAVLKVCRQTLASLQPNLRLQALSQLFSLTTQHGCFIAEV